MLANDDQTRSFASSGRAVVILVALGQIAFAAGIALCVVLSPHLDLHVNEGGISNFGVHAKTVAPYTVALASPALLSYLASRLVYRHSAEGHLRVVLRAYSGLILLTLLTTYTYKIDTPLKIIHVAVGVVLTIFEMGASLWMSHEIHALYGVVALQLVGFVLAALTIVGVLHVLFVTQMVMGVAFALVIVRTCRVLTAPSAPSAPDA